MAMSSADQSDVHKRSPTRGNSDAAPPRAKAKSRPEGVLSDEEMAVEDETEMQQLLRMVRDIQGQTRKLDKLETDIKEMKGELNERLDDSETHLKKRRHRRRR